MASKQLSVIVQAVDRATGGLRVIANGVLGVGTAASKSDTKTTGFLGRMLGGLTSLKGLLGAAAAGFGAFQAVGSFNAAAKELDDLNDMAGRLGLSIEHLSELRYISRLSGVDLQTLAGGISTLQKNVAQFVATGGGKAADAIKRMGVRLTDANGQVRETSELLPEIARGLQNVGGQAEQLEVVKRLFGDDKFLQFIRESPAALARMAEEARRLGVIFTPAQAKAAAEYSDGLDRVKEAWLGLRVKLVEQLGPTLAGWLNQAAGFIAAIPTMVGNLAENIRKALGGDSGAKAKFGAFFDSLKNLARQGAEGAWRIVQAVSILGIEGVGDIINNRVESSVTEIFATLPFLLLKGLTSTAAAVAGMIGEGNPIAKTIRSYLVGSFKADGLLLDVEIGKIRGLARKARSSIELMDESMRSMVSGNSSDFAAFNKILGDVGTNLRTASGGVLDSIDALLGMTEALKGTSVAGAEATRLAGLFAGESEDAATGTWSWARALEGAKDQWKAIAREARDAYSWGKTFTSQLTDQIAGGLTTALLDGVTGVKSLGEAFREFGASTLRMISEVITKMLILRAITAIGGSLFGGGGASKAWMPGAGVNVLGDIPGARRGGVMLPGGVMAYGMGDVVGGARLGRDYRPAVLAAGEGVLNAPAVARNGAAMVHYMNGGGRVQPMGGGGASIHVENNITIQGGGNVRQQDLRAISEAATQGVLRGLRNNPGLRGEMRGLLA